MKRFLEKITAVFDKIFVLFGKSYKKLLSLIGNDGQLHIQVSIIATMLIGTLCNICDAPVLWNVLIPIITVLIIGAIKEIIDYFSETHTAELKDFICDFVGAILGGILVLLLLI